MTGPDQLKQIIAATWRDEEMASAACHGVEAYARLWSHVFLVNDWRVWNESRQGLNREVIRWLDGQGSAWDFYHLLGEWGLVGFDDPNVAARFEQRWHGAADAEPSCDRAWNPHPLSSTFAPGLANASAMRSRQHGHAIR